MSLIYQWIRKLPSIYDETQDAPKPSIAVDIEGNFYVAYTCFNAVSAGQTHVGLIDICVAKFSSDGQAMWYRQQPSFDTTLDDIEPSICVDANKNVYVSYCTGGSISGQTAVIDSVEIVVFKMDTDGNTLWVKQSPDFNNIGNDYAPSIAADGNGNVYVAYYSEDPGTPVTYYDNIIVFKLDTNGNLVWIKKAHTFNTPGGNYNPNIVVDDSSNCYVAYFCDGSAASGETEVGGYDIVVFKMDGDGNLLWIRQRPTFDTTASDFSPSIAVDSNGATYIAYHTYGGTVSGQTYTGGLYDIIVFKMDTQGTVVWVKENQTFNTIEDDYATAIGIDPLGNIYVAYTTTGVTSGQTLTGSQDVVIMQMDNNGNTLGVLQQTNFNTLYENVYPSIAVDLNGNCGITYYSVNPGLGDESSSQTLVVFKLRNLVCVAPGTQILMDDGTTKPVELVKRGDWVAPHHQVARVCREPIDIHSQISLVVFEKGAFGTRPDQRLVVTPNHPIVYHEARRPAKCFVHCPGVTGIDQQPLTQVVDLLGGDPEAVALYDLQFDHEGSYVANGVEVQSRSPYSYYGPLPKDLYFDPELYSDDRVWDTVDHYEPLDSTPVTHNIYVLKNKHHKWLDPTSVVQYQK
uniref:Hedgehog/Intein (Hint) domain-containing protein n=1 Tax=viral metagenome TaxID=1070528 RepID=A0A6C0BLG3_9ZZZZ